MSNEVEKMAAEFFEKTLSTNFDKPKEHYKAGYAQAVKDAEAIAEKHQSLALTGEYAQGSRDAHWAVVHKLKERCRE